MRDLLDTSVWFTLAHPGHPFHQHALSYWKNDAALELAFAWPTALGLLRLLTNARATGGEPLTSLQAWEVFEAFLERPGVSVHPEPAGIGGLLREYAEHYSLRAGHWTDAYLAAFARAGGYRLVTFDRDFINHSVFELLLLGNK